MILLYLEVTPPGDKFNFLSMGTVFQYQLMEGEATSSFGSSAFGAVLKRGDPRGVQPTSPKALPCEQTPLCFRWQKLSPIPLSCLLHRPLTSRSLFEH